MGENSKIEWTHHTFNPWTGCTKVSPGCKYCYAETFSGRKLGHIGEWGPKGSRKVTSEAYWRKPLQWDASARDYPDQCARCGVRLHKEVQARIGNKRCPSRRNAEGEFDGSLPACGGEILENVRPRVFCASLADVFEAQDTMPAESWEPVHAARQRLFALARQTKHLDWLFLTKRPENIAPILATLTHPEYPNTDWWTLQQRQPRPNWWFGASGENQSALEERADHLVAVPAAVHFLSLEPLLGQLDISRWTSPPGEWKCPKCRFVLHKRTLYARTGEVGIDDDAAREVCPNDGATLIPNPCIDWVIAGGESGPHARPMHPDWVRSLQDQCQAAAVPFLFKQWGEWSPTGPLSVPDCAVDRAGRVVPGMKPEDFPRHASSADGWQRMYRIGKKAAGRTLDGRTWDQFPK